MMKKDEERERMKVSGEEYGQLRVIVSDYSTFWNFLEFFEIKSMFGGLYTIFGRMS